jgi:hypothetical protein
MIRSVLFLLIGLLTLNVLAGEPGVSIYGDDVLCLHPERMTLDSMSKLFSAPAPTTNILSGTVLDLRFLDGDDTAVDAVAKLVTDQKTPLVILANGETRGGAAALALRLRLAGRGIIIGSTNAPGTISPDIALNISADREKAFLADPFMDTTNDVSLADTNDILPLVDHTSEAELVQKRIKDGEEDDSTPTVRPDAATPYIHDPALARAVDLIKALAIVHTTKG